MEIPAELLACLRELERNPLTRVSHEKEEQLVRLGLVQRGAGFVSITEAGRAALREHEPRKS